MSALVRKVHKARQSASKPLTLVLLHGLGSNEDDLLGLVEYLDPRLTVISMRAPHQMDSDGFSWFDVDWSDGTFNVDGQQAIESVETMQQELKALRAESEGPLWLAGFSQGAMISMGIVLKDPTLVDGAVLMSGFPLEDLIPSEAPDGLAGFPIFVQHGTMDTLLPVAFAREMGQTLNQLGAEVSYREYNMGHEVSMPSVRDMSTWLRVQADTKLEN